tara:strand:+ start:132 stop:1193 length:1062 start_codon:yes stop_codon:yes gene_type:complete
MDLSMVINYLNTNNIFYLEKFNDKNFSNSEIKKYLLSILSFIETLKYGINSNQIYSIFNNPDNIISIPFLLDEPKEYTFNQGYYINLEQSVDRKTNIENINFKIKMERFEAIKHNNGNIGCSMSHIKLLKSLLEQETINENTYFLIVEDDIQIVNVENYDNLLINLHNVFTYYSPDIIVLSGTDKIVDITSYYGFGFYKLLKSHTTSSYIVNYKFIPELIKKFTLGLEALLKINNEDKQIIRDQQTNLYACDQIWNNNIITENWMLYYDMDIIRPNLSFTSTIYPELIHNDTETEKNLLESFSTCICVNKNFYPIRKSLFYHEQFNLLVNVIKNIEYLSKGKIKCLYKNKIKI